MVLPSVFEDLKMTNYLLAIPFLLPGIVACLPNPYVALGDSVLFATNHPDFLLYMRIAEEILKLVFNTLFVVVFSIPQLYGIQAIIWLLPCGVLLPTILKTIIVYLYIHRKIMKVQISVWQTFVAPLISTLIIFIMGLVFRYLIFDPIMKLAGTYVAVIFAMIFLIFLLEFVYFPMIALLGGYDDDNLEIFHKASELSGPSRFLVIPLYRRIARVCKTAKMHNRYKMDSEGALQEATELLALKMKNQNN
jgi:hypothetical protein